MRFSCRKYWITLTSFLMVVLQWHKVYGAGVNIHLIYLARVTSGLDRKYEPWLKSGAFFPDAFYTCKPNKQWHDFAESTHWPQFLVNAAELWHNKYDNDPECDDSMIFKSFLIGLFTHQIVDSSWHSLVHGYRSQGLLKVLAHTEFDGRIQEAHNFLDVIGDFIGLGNIIRDVNDKNWEFLTRTQWYLPKEEDMLDLIKCAGPEGIDVSYKELEDCVQRGFAVSIGEIFTILQDRNQILKAAYEVSPRARDLMQDYWLGGEFNLISLMRTCLPNLYKLFDFKKNKDVNNLGELQLCGNLPLAYQMGLKSYNEHINLINHGNVIRITTNHSLSNLGASLALGKFKNDQKLYLAIGAPLENNSGVVHLVSWDQIINGPGNYFTSYSIPTTTMIGAKIHVYHTDTMDFLLISEPSSNSMLFYHDDLLMLKVHLACKNRFSQLEVTKVYDIDHDGKPDVILSGWSYGEHQEGCIMIIPGKSIVPNFQKSQAKNNSIVLETFPNIIVEGGWWSQPYQHFGSEIEVSCSRLLYIACQSLGVVLVYSSVELSPNSQPKFILKGKELSWATKKNLSQLKILSSQEHGMFGKVIISWCFQGKHFIGISQPTFSTIFIYKELHGFVRFYLKLKLPVELDPIPYSIGFGYDMQYSMENEALFVSSPGYIGGLGAIWNIPMTQIIKTSEYWKRDFLLINPKTHLKVHGDDTDQKGLGNYGKNFLLGPQNKLIIGVPQYNYGIVEGDSQLTGMVLIS